MDTQLWLRSQKLHLKAGLKGGEGRLFQIQDEKLCQDPV